LRLRRVLIAGAAIAVAVLAGGSTTAALAGSHDHAKPPADSLRTLASPINLRIGSAVNPPELDNAAMVQIIGDQFSTVTPENEMKWQVVEPTRGTYDWSGADREVAFAQEHGQLVRGHTLVWHNQLPDWLTSGVAGGTISNTELRALLHKHITDEVTHFKGKIWQWDVANEFFANAWDPNPLPSGINGDNFWVVHLGEGILADAFRWAHQADPKALLVYNDFNIGGEDGTNAKADAVFNWAKSLLAQGVPIDVIGNQGHLDTQYGFSGQRLADDLARYATLGVKVAMTEVDVRTFVNNATEQVPTSNLALFAQPYEYIQMLRACLEVKECISFTVWGFSDVNSWVPGFFTGEGYACIYDVNLNPKQAFTDLQHELMLARNGAARRR
jgi:endo-1,4-beta-xylanase